MQQDKKAEEENPTNNKLIERCKFLTYSRVYFTDAKS